MTAIRRLFQAKSGTLFQAQHLNPSEEDVKHEQELRMFRQRNIT